MNVRMVALLMVSLFGLAQSVLYWTQLPARVAIHFAIDGTPDDWQSKEVSMLLILTVQIVLPWLFVLLARALVYIPDQFINIPNRKYWLSEERKPLTQRIVGNFLTEMALIISIYVAWVNHLCYSANMANRPLNTTMLFCLLAIFIAITIVLLIRITLQFRLSKQVR